MTPPDSARAAFEALASSGVISVELAVRLGRAAGMRNLLVHDYTRIDRSLLAAVVQHDLEDLRAFGAALEPLVATGAG